MTLDLASILKGYDVLLLVKVAPSSGTRGEDRKHTSKWNLNLKGR